MQAVERGEFAESCLADGVARHVAMAISGHKTESMYQRYNIVSEADLRAAAEKTQLYLDTLPVKSRVISNQLGMAGETSSRYPCVRPCHHAS